MLRSILYTGLAVLLAACSPKHEPLPAGATILCIGDSITYGIGAASDESYPVKLNAKLPEITVLNAGVPGERVPGTLSRIDRLLSDTAPSLVLLEIGGNDFLHGEKSSVIQSNLDTLIARIRAQNIPVVLVGVPEINALRIASGFTDSAPLYETLADEHELVLINSTLPEILANNKLKADPIHPNAAGYQKLADEVFVTLQKSGFVAK